MPFVTKLDSSNNRQIKQYQKTHTAYSGASIFGLPFSALTTGPNTHAIVATEVFTAVTSTFSGDSGTTLYSWYDPRMDLATSAFTGLYSATTGDTQVSGDIFTSYSSTTIDGNLINLQYTGVSFDSQVLTKTSLGGGAFSGTLYHYQVRILSTPAIDFNERLIWVDVNGITRTNKLLITDGATNGYVWTCIDASTGEGTWTAVSGGSGSINSIGLSLPSEFDVADSPLTSDGVITATWVAQPANYVFAGPANGAADIPSFRNLVSSDIPAGGNSNTLQFNNGGVLDGTPTFTYDSSIPGIVSQNSYYIAGFDVNSGSGFIGRSSGSYTFQFGINNQARYGGTINTLSGRQWFLYDFQETNPVNAYRMGVNGVGDLFYGSTNTDFSVKMTTPIFSATPLTVRGTFGQTADIFKVTDYTNVSLLSVASNGTLNLPVYSGGTTRMLVVNSGGTVSTQVIPSGGTDTYTTGGTANNSTKVYTFTNNTGGTFNVTALNDISITGGTYTAGTATLTNNTGGTFSITGFSTGNTFVDTTVTGGTGNNSTKVYTFTNNTGGTFNVTALTDISITGGSHSNGISTFTNNTGGTFTISGFSTGVTISTIGSTPNASGATLNSGILSLQPASASFGGVVSTTGQTWTGQKTFQGSIISDYPSINNTNILPSTGYTLTTGWTGTFTSGFTHSIEDTTGVITNTGATAVVGTVYRISYLVSSGASIQGLVNVNFGGISLSSSGSGRTGLFQKMSLATTTASIQIVATLDFVGVISSISVQVMSPSSATTVFASSDGVVRNEIRTSTASGNTFMGESSGKFTISGFNNTFIGAQAGQYNTIGTDNIMIGVSAGTRNAEGALNILIGNKAGYSSFIANQNLYIGHSAGYNDLRGPNIAIGYLAYSGITQGGNNTIIGYGAASGTSNSNISNNTFMGHLTCPSISFGNDNVFLGYQAGKLHASLANLTNISSSILIGSDTKARADSNTNSIVIGYQAIGLGSNTTVIGNTSTTGTTLFGLISGTSILTNSASSFNFSGRSMTLNSTSSAMTASTKAILELVSTTQGFRMPRLTNAQRIVISGSSADTQGIEVYQTDATPGFFYHDGTTWQRRATVSSIQSYISNGSSLLGGGTITTSGVIAFTWVGSSAQIVLGDGTLGTLPTAGSAASIDEINNDFTITDKYVAPQQLSQTQYSSAAHVFAHLNFK